jgi:hypothetical protein
MKEIMREFILSHIDLPGWNRGGNFEIFFFSLSVELVQE